MLCNQAQPPSLLHHLPSSTYRRVVMQPLTHGLHTSLRNAWLLLELHAAGKDLPFGSWGTRLRIHLQEFSTRLGFVCVASLTSSSLWVVFPGLHAMAMGLCCNTSFSFSHLAFSGESSTNSVSCSIIWDVGEEKLNLFRLVAEYWVGLQGSMGALQLGSFSKSRVLEILSVTTIIPIKKVDFGRLT